MDLFYSHVTQNKVCNVKYKVLFLPHGLYGIIFLCFACNKQLFHSSYRYKHLLYILY